MLLKVDPCPKPRMTRSDAWKKRPAVMRYWDFADKVREQMDHLSRENPEKQTDSIMLTFGIPIPKSKSKKFRKENLGKKHRSKPDLDNFVKAILDVIYADDSHISEIHARKVWSDEGYILMNWI